MNTKFNIVDHIIQLLLIVGIMFIIPYGGFASAILAPIVYIILIFVISLIQQILSGAWMLLYVIAGLGWYSMIGVWGLLIIPVVSVLLLISYNTD